MREISMKSFFIVAWPAVLVAATGFGFVAYGAQVGKPDWIVGLYSGDAWQVAAIGAGLIIAVWVPYHQTQQMNEATVRQQRMAVLQQNRFTVTVMRRAACVINQIANSLEDPVAARPDSKILEGPIQTLGLLRQFLKEHDLKIDPDYKVSELLLASLESIIQSEVNIGHAAACGVEHPSIRKNLANKLRGQAGVFEDTARGLETIMNGRIKGWKINID